MWGCCGIWWEQFSHPSVPVWIKTQRCARWSAYDYLPSLHQEVERWYFNALLRGFIVLSLPAAMLSSPFKHHCLNAGHSTEKQDKGKTLMKEALHLSDSCAFTIEIHLRKSVSVHSNVRSKIAVRSWNPDVTCNIVFIVIINICSKCASSSSAERWTLDRSLTILVLTVQYCILLKCTIFPSHVSIPVSMSPCQSKSPSIRESYKR